MDELSFQLLQFMKEDFGDLGPFFLSKEMKELGLTDLNKITTEQKEHLVENLLRNVFSRAMSEQKLGIKKSYLESIMYQEHAETKTTDKEKTQILMGSYKIGIEGSPDAKKREAIIPVMEVESKIQSARTTTFKNGLFIGIGILIFLIFTVVVVNDIIGFDKILSAPAAKNRVQPTQAQPTTSPANPISNTANQQPTPSSNPSMQEPATNTHNQGTSTQPNPTTTNFQNNTDNGTQNNPTIPNNYTISNVTYENKTNTTSVSPTPSPSPSTDQSPTASNLSAPPQNNAPNNSITNSSSNTTTNITLNTTQPENITPKRPQDCTVQNMGSIQFNISDKHFYGCNGTEWKRLDN